MHTRTHLPMQIDIRHYLWVQKILLRRVWQLTPVFFTRESHGQRSLMGFSPWDYKESDMLKWLSTNTHSSVQFSHSVVSNSATPWIAAYQASLSITNTRSSLRLTSIESVMPSSHLILCRPLLLLPLIPLSIRVFSNESTLCMRWPKYWNFSFSIIPSKEIPGLISFRMDWLDLLAVQGTLKSLLQHHSSKAEPHNYMRLKMWPDNKDMPSWAEEINRGLEFQVGMMMES